MASATVRVKDTGAWRELAPVWSLNVTSDEHGPSDASFVCKDRLLQFADIEIMVGGLVVFDGWVEDAETSEGLCTVTAAGWQRHLDDDPYDRTYFISGFAKALDARAGARVDPAYWVRNGLQVSERGLMFGVAPGHIWYLNQAMGVTYDLGTGGAGPSVVWVRQQAVYMPQYKGLLYLYIRAHSTRSNHSPAVAGQYVSMDQPAYQGDYLTAGGDRWLGPFTFAANQLRYVTIMALPPTTLDEARDQPEYYWQFSEVRISTLTPGGMDMAPSDAVAHIVSKAPLLTLGTNTLSPTRMTGLSTDGYQTPRQMLDRLTVDQFRYRVNPGRRLDREPYPALPTFTISDPAIPTLRYPEIHSRVIVSYSDPQGDQQEAVASMIWPRQRSQVLALDSPATPEQAQVIANAAITDESQRKVEGLAAVPPGALKARPSGEPLHPSRLLLAGGDRVFVDAAGGDARIVGVNYDSETETAEVSLSAPQDSLDRALQHLATGEA